MNYEFDEKDKKLDRFLYRTLTQLFSYDTKWARKYAKMCNNCLKSLFITVNFLINEEPSIGKILATRLDAER